MQLSELARIANPQATVLFLGAGSSIPSGGPTGPELATVLSKDLAGENEPLGEDLQETCSILEQRYGRIALVAAVRARLGSLQPTGGLLALPEFDWAAIYTTNYDRLIERAYQRFGKPLSIIRSNMDYGSVETTPATSLFKIHGCVSQDAVDGHAARMVLTERDLEESERYRQALFSRLELDMMTRDCVIIGYSLRDIDLRRSMDSAARLHSTLEAPGRLFALIHIPDDDRAAIQESKGYRVAWGGVDDFAKELTAAAPAEVPVDTPTSEATILPIALRPVTIDAAHSAGLEPNPLRLYNGSPASYGDIRSSLTIPRTGEQVNIAAIERGEARFVVVLGAAGVGKTTLARRLAHALTQRGWLAWEHRPEFPFSHEAWLRAEENLREVGEKGVLVVDECTPFLSQINRLANRLADIDDSRLAIIITSAHSQWQPRVKSPQLFRVGNVVSLSRLSNGEIDELVNLLDREPSIRSQVDESFANRSRREKVDHLRRKCKADMYVCLKNIFAHDELDVILLREYAALDEGLQSVYRHVSALEATGGKVHRQLVIGLLGIEAKAVAGLLGVLEGIIEEYDVRPDEGVFGWATRHRVIARTIARYKFANHIEKAGFFSQTLDALNPTVWLELNLLREMCDRETGVGSIPDEQLQVDLYRKMVAVAPGERVPRHRLIAKYLYSGELELAEQEIREAERAVGLDPPISRYKVLLSLRRARTLTGVLDEDRYAMLLEAEKLALDAINTFKDDKYAYKSYGEVGLTIGQLFGVVEVLDAAIAKMKLAAERILDPELTDSIRELEQKRAVIVRKIDE